MEKLGQVDVDHTERQVVTISQDSFYRELSQQDKAKALKGQYNFDHPGKLMLSLVYLIIIVHTTCLSALVTICHYNNCLWCDL